MMKSSLKTSVVIFFAYPFFLLALFLIKLFSKENDIFFFNSFEIFFEEGTVSFSMENTFFLLTVVLFVIVFLIIFLIYYLVDRKKGI